MTNNSTATSTNISPVLFLNSRYSYRRLHVRRRWDCIGPLDLGDFNVYAQGFFLFPGKILNPAFVVVTPVHSSCETA